MNTPMLRTVFGLTFTSLLPLTGIAKTINVNPGDNVASIVAAAPAGTKFYFMAGTYRMQKINAKEGDTFVGPSTRSAVLTGAQVIHFSRVPGSSPALWSSQIGSMPKDQEGCLKGHMLCQYDRDVFFGGAALLPVQKLSDLSKTTYYYDAANGAAVINFDPGGRVTEVSTTDCAICGYFNHVTVQSLTIEKYAAPWGSGAVGQFAAGSYWTVQNVEGRFNHGAAVKVGPHSDIENNYLHHNGDLGLGAHGAGITVKSNEFSFNNYAWYGYSGEAGGAKFGGLETALISDNYVHDNNGDGLWDDMYSIDVHYLNNKVVNNAGTGIQHELGYNAVIEDNELTHNGAVPRVSLWDGGVSVQNSNNTVVRNNKITVAALYGSGIAIINQDRGVEAGYKGPTNAANNTIENNDITFEGSDGAGGLMGIASSAGGNVIDYNTYHAPAGTDKHHFEAFGVKTFGQFQANGYDVHSKMVWTK